MNPGLLFMQNSSWGNVAQITFKKLESQSILTIFWPAFSSNLNQIETI